MRENVAAAAGNVNERTFLPEAEPGRHGKHHSYRFDYEGPLAEVSTDYEAAEDSLDLEVRSSSTVMTDRRIVITLRVYMAIILKNFERTRVRT